MSTKSSLSNNNLEKILKIYSNEDERINKIGQILTSQKSREIYKILINSELNAKEIAKRIYQNDTSKLSNLIFILNKMVSANLVTRQKRRQLKTGHSLTFYKAVPAILIVPSEYFNKVNNSKILQNTFKKIFSDFE